MAGDTTDDAVGGDWSDSLAQRLGIDHRHSAGTAALAVVFALLCGIYASWLLADFGLRWPVLIIALVGSGVLFYGQPTRNSVVALGLYCLAALLALTPVILNLVFVVDSSRYGVANPWPAVLTIADLVFLVVFVVFALVLSGIASLIDQ